VWLTCVSSMQLPVRLHVTPAIHTSVLASVSVLLILFIICVLSLWKLVGATKKTGKNSGLPNMHRIDSNQLY
jgi:hypothetical protein